AGLSVCVEECAAFNMVVTFPADCEVGGGFLELDGLGGPLSGESCSELVGGIQHPGISGFGRKEHQRTDGDKAGIVGSSPALNGLDLLGRRKCLPATPRLSGPALIFLRFTSFSKPGVESSSHGTVHEAFRRVAALRIPLL